MGMAMFLLPLLSLIGLVGFIWLCVVAFKKHAVWGLLVLFLSPITAIVFAIKNWQESKKPFLVYMGSFVACMAMVGYMFATVGMQLMGLAESAQAEMTEQAAVDMPAAAPEQPAVEGALDPQEEAELRRMQQSLREMQEQQSADAAAPGQPQDEPTPRISMGPDGKAVGLTPGEEVPAVAGGADGNDYLSSVVPPGFHSVPVGQASQYVGKKILVVSKGGREIVGKLADADPHVLLVERELQSGTITFELPAADVATLLVAYQ